MTRANILLTRNGQKSVCVIDSSAYPNSLPDILTQFDDWVSEWDELRINAMYVYEINYDSRTVRGWQHECENWSVYSIQTALKKSVSGLIKAWLPDGWTVSWDRNPIRFSDYGIDHDGCLNILKSDLGL
jgi:hypothetical protein